MSVLAFVGFWLLTGLIWGGLCSLFTRRGLIADSIFQDIIGGLIGYAVSWLLFGGQPEGFFLFAVVIVVTTAKLSQDFFTRRT